MIDYGPFLFAAPPRTGSTWFLKACYEVGLGEGFKSDVHTLFPPDARKLKVSLVRHPFNWLISYFAAIQGGHTGIDCVDRLASLDFSGTFVDFIRSYLEKTPGALTNIARTYNADSYLRTEDLPWPFMELVEAAGISEQKARRAVALGRQNPNKKSAAIRLAVTYPIHLYRDVMNAEKELTMWFEYHI